MSDHQFYDAPDDGTAYILRESDPTYPLHILMLHGWSGDERVMWILESVLPAEAPVASMRGTFPLNENGYQWTEQRASIESTKEDFTSAIQAVKVTLKTLTDNHSFAAEKLVLMGFSQGAALSFALAGALDITPKAIIALAGYYPQSREDRIVNIPIFWGHGTSDVLVPVNRARLDVELLESRGAEVHYCEADVGHKLGIECTRGLKQWLSELDGDRR